jgi:hypothetical protein
MEGMREMGKVYLVDYYGFQTASYMVYYIEDNSALDENFFLQEEEINHPVFEALYYHIGDTILSRTKVLDMALSYANNFSKLINASLENKTAFKLSYPKQIGGFNKIQTDLYVAGTAGIEDDFSVIEKSILIYYYEEKNMVIEVEALEDRFTVAPHGTGKQAFSCKNEEELQNSLFNMLVNL